MMKARAKNVINYCRIVTPVHQLLSAPNAYQTLIMLPMTRNARSASNLTLNARHAIIAQNALPALRIPIS